MERDKDILIVDHRDVMNLISFDQNSDSGIAPSEFFKWHDGTEGTIHLEGVKQLKFNFEDKDLQDLFKKVFKEYQDEK